MEALSQWLLDGYATSCGLRPPDNELSGPPDKAFAIISVFACRLHGRLLLDFPMMTTFWPGRTLLTAAICVVALSTFAHGDDRFAITIGPHDMLAIFSPDGKKIPEITAPSVGVPVAVGDTSFQVSFGRDARQRLTAIIAPSASDPADLHFNVFGKAVDADKNAVVTLTFSPDARTVTIDPGMTGRVEVNSQRLRHHEPTPVY